MNSISFLLDENITPRAEKYLNSLGFKCNHIVTLGYQGYSDEQVLNLAKEMDSCLCTMNGRDFLIQVIPRGSSEHPGLFWVVDNITRKNYKDVFNLIIEFVKRVNGMRNKIVKLKEYSEGFQIEQRYPNKESIMLMFYSGETLQ